jgi:ribosomal protein L37AE/L43A
MASAQGLRRSLKGLSEVEFRERFGTEEACRKALFDMRWREGLTCPACEHRGFCRLKARKLFQCNRCKKQVRLTAGTVFQDTKLPLTVPRAPARHRAGLLFASNSPATLNYARGVRALRRPGADLEAEAGVMGG